jgi:hypothetical protein
MGYGTPFVSDDTCVETSEEDEESMQCPPIIERYTKQTKSALGKVAYVVYAGNDVGVFYNW